VDLNPFYIGTANSGAGNPLLNFQLDLNSYVNQATLIVSSNIQYGGGTVSGTNSILLTGGINGGSGQTFTINDTTTSTNIGGLTWQITNVGTIMDGTTTLLNFNFTTTGNATNSTFDPANNPITLDTGVGPLARNDYAGFLAPGADVNISDVSVTVGAVPEPSTYALLGLGLAAMVIVSRIRRRSA